MRCPIIHELCVNTCTAPITTSHAHSTHRCTLVWGSTRGMHASHAAHTAECPLPAPNGFYMHAHADVRTTRTNIIAKAPARLPSTAVQAHTGAPRARLMNKGGSGGTRAPPDVGASGDTLSTTKFWPRANLIQRRSGPKSPCTPALGAQRTFVAALVVFLWPTQTAPPGRSARRACHGYTRRAEHERRS